MIKKEKLWIITVSISYGCSSPPEVDSWLVTEQEAREMLENYRKEKNVDFCYIGPCEDKIW